MNDLVICPKKSCTAICIHKAPHKKSPVCEQTISDYCPPCIPVKHTKLIGIDMCDVVPVRNNNNNTYNSTVGV